MVYELGLDEQRNNLEIASYVFLESSGDEDAKVFIEIKQESKSCHTLSENGAVSSESIEELKGDLELIKDVILVESELGISFSISDGFDNDDQEMLYFLANSIRKIPQEMKRTSYNAEVRLIPATEVDTKNLFKPEFSIRYTEIVNNQNSTDMD